VDQNPIYRSTSCKEVQDITQASVAQLARLTSEILRRYTWHLVISQQGPEPKQQWLNGCMTQSMLPMQQHSVDSSASQLQQDATYMLTLYQQSDEPVPSQ